MKQQHGKGLLAIRSLVMIVLGTVLFSFSERVGGDHFSIHLNERLLLKVFVFEEKGVKNIALTSADPNDVLRVRYSHCGKTGVKRALAIQDSHKRTLKRWSFAGNASPEMMVSMKEILSVAKKSRVENLQLVYSAVEIPEGMTLASFSASDNVKASLN